MKDNNICWDILDTYFKKGGSTESVNPHVKHQIDSYNKFIDSTLGHIISGFNPIKITNTLKNENGEQSHKIYINVNQPSLTKPSYHLQDGTQTVMTPYIARMNKLSYSSSLYVNVHLLIEVINKDGVIEKFDKTISGVYIGKIPVMVRSKACILHQIPGLGEENNNECRYDYGGYFIINGSEKVLISQDRINENKTHVFQPNNNSEGLYAEIRSMSDISYLPTKTTSLNMSGKLNHMGRIIRMNTSFIRSEVPVFVMFRALGIISDKEIIQHIVYDLDKEDNKRIITELMACCEDASEVHTQKQAEAVLIKIMMGANKTSNVVELLRTNITNDFLPHVGKNYRRKALYLGFMVRKMIRIYLGYDNYDNRDSYMNKRIDTPGILMSILFRQCYGKMTKEIKSLIERELNLWRSNQSNVPTVDIISDNNIHRYFRQSLLESWLKYSLSTGNWGIKVIGSFQTIRQGVSQVLNRMSYASTLSHLRRINTAMEKNGKLVQPRKLDNSQMGMICPAECFDPDTPILLWNGTIKKAADIIIGDYLIDDEGNSVRVKSTCSGEKMMYEVIQHKNNFMNYTVTDNHILTLKVKKYKNVRNHRGKIEFSWFDKKELKYKYKHFNNTEDLNEFSSSIDDDNVIDITIEQYLSLPENIQKQLYTFKSNGINWETKEVALDPYILGMWLGNGLSTCYEFATADKELLDEYIKWGVDNDATITKGNRYSYSISSTINNTQTGINCNKSEKVPLKKLLAKYNLINNKHIPLDYLTNDRKTRLAVLAGLIDTDGNVRANGHEIRICQGEPNYKIIYDAEFLARSLGFSCHLNDGTCYYTVNDKKKKLPCKELTITGKYLYEIPTIFPRKKLNKYNNTTHEKRSDGFLQSSFGLVKKDIQPFVGWQLEGNGRFLLGDMSVSHNTPEGSSVGLVKNMALSTNISLSMNSTYIRELLVNNGTVVYNDKDFSYIIENELEWFNETPETKIKLEKITEYLKNLGNYNNVYIQVNGDIIGYHTSPNILYTKLKHYKRCGMIHPMTSIIWNIKNHIIIISTEAGRMYRPLLIVDIDSVTGKRELRIMKILREKNMTWEEFNKDKTFDSYIAPCAYMNDYNDTSHTSNEDGEIEGFVEYLDSDEINNSMIAMYPSELEKGMKGTAYPPFYTHCEIHPSLMNGILGVNIPFSDHNQSPRNCYQCISENENVLMGNGTYKKIKDIVIGDDVICFNLKTNQSEHTKVINHYNRNTTKVVYNINLVNGRTITATSDHDFMTNNGWKNCTKFDKNTLIGIYMNSNHTRVNNVYMNSCDVVYTILNETDNINIYKELDIMPLKNDNGLLVIIAKIAGYYYDNRLNFTNDYVKESFNNDVKFIGFKEYGLYDTKFIYYINKLIENIEWVEKCSDMIQNSFLSGYLSSVYPDSIDKLKESNINITDSVILNIMNKNEISTEWYNNINETIKLYKNIGLYYNSNLIKDIAIISEYTLHKEYCNLVNIDKIRKVYSLAEWKEVVYINGDLIYIPFNIIYKNNNNKISDITVQSDNHNFIAGNGFAVSNCAMGKQALGIYASNFNKRIDTMGNILNYAQKPLVYTKLSNYTYSNELPSGTNAIVAIMTHTGFNQEDSVMINQSALDRGLFTSTYYKSVKDQCSKNHSTGEEEVFVNPINVKAVSTKPFSYKKIDNNGMIPKNTFVDGNDIIIGKVMPKKTNGVIVNQDSSLSLKANDEGYVDMNYVGTNSEGYKFCNVRIRKNRKPEIGDKLACFSPEHEYLTTEGWISVADLTLDHKIATLDDGELVYQNPIELHKFDYKGQMYRLESAQVNLLTTPNHRMLVRGKHPGAIWNIKKADEIYHTRFKMKKDADNWNPDYTQMPDDIAKYFIITEGKITHFKLDGYTNKNKIYETLIIDIEDWLMIYGIYVAEGTVCKGAKSCTSIAANKPRVQKVLDEIALKKQVKITIVMDKGEPVKRHICSKLISRHFDEEHVIAITKYLKNWVWWLNRDHCQMLIHALCLGDGCFSGNSSRYYTSSTKLADDFQRLCLHAGYSANKALKVAKGTRNLSLEKFNKKVKENRGQINVETVESYSNADHWMLSVIKAQNEPVINKNIVSENHPKYNDNEYHDKWVDYDGKVFCCTVKNDASIYVRHNGVTIFTKNSRSAQKGTIGMVYRQQDMPFTMHGITPDIIMNPHAVPSRMTMAQLMECIMGKAACHIGTVGDATPFTDCSVESIAKVLELSGMERYGNEIMYNGRTGEQIKTEIFIGPTYYQRLKHMVQDKSHCLKADHEVLTSNGWKFIKEVTMDDEVAILKDSKLVYEKPLEIHHYPDYEGKMYRIKNSSIDLDVTANHRMYIKTCHTRNKIWGDYRLEKAEDIVGKMVKYKKNAEWDAPTYQFILPAFEEYTEKILDMNSWLTFFGIWLAEGWAYNETYKSKYRIGFAVNKQRVKDVLYDAITKLGYHYNVCEEHLEINNKQLHAYLAPLSVGALNKYMPDWVWKIDKEQSRLLVHSIQLGDGCFNKTTTCSVYYTSSTRLADDFMRLLLHAGWSGNKACHIKAGANTSYIKEKEIKNNYDIWKISVLKTRNEPCVNHSHHKKQVVQEEEIYDYKGPVYCLSVSSEVFMIRRNGKQVWTGNSRGSNGPIVMLTRQPSEGRARNGGLRLGEMERDCLIGHGISEFLKEKMLDTSDNYRIFVCKNCGLTANANPTKNIYKCNNCKNYADIIQVRVPYAFKLLGQELYTMNIKMGFICN